MNKKIIENANFALNALEGLKLSLDSIYQDHITKTNVSDAPKADGHLRSIQLNCLNILRALLPIFEQHNIEYWLDFGTLLGAARHKGFIPWDHDIDICCLRKDFIRLNEILKTELPNTFEVRPPVNTSFQLRINDRASYIGLDIFVVDGAAPRFSGKNLNELPSLIDAAGKAFTIKCAKSGGRLNNLSAAWHEIDNLTSSFSDITCSGDLLYYGIDFPHRMKSLIIEKSDIFPLRKMEFEGIYLNVPAQTEKLLSNSYGNYNSWPKKLFVDYSESTYNQELIDLYNNNLPRKRSIVNKTYTEDGCVVTYRLFGMKIWRKFLPEARFKMLSQQILHLFYAISALK